MKRAIHTLAKEAIVAYAKANRTSWMLQWPGQLVLSCSQANYSYCVERSHVQSASQHTRPGVVTDVQRFCFCCCAPGVLDTRGLRGDPERGHKGPCSVRTEVCMGMAAARRQGDTALTTLGLAVLD